MTPESHALIVDSIKSLQKHFDGVLEGLDKRLARIETQVTLTNGRVTELETKGREAQAVSEDRDRRSTDRRLGRGEWVSFAGVLVATWSATVAAVLAADKLL